MIKQTKEFDEAFKRFVKMYKSDIAKGKKIVDLKERKAFGDKLKGKISAFEKKYNFKF